MFLNYFFLPKLDVFIHQGELGRAVLSLVINIDKLNLLLAPINKFQELKRIKES